jgi:hypothetical protein
VSKLPPRIKKLEHEMPRPWIVLHAGPGVTPEEARAAYERRNGPIPPNAKVTTIIHTFVSPLSFRGRAELDD